MAKGASSLSKTAVWILLGLLIVGLAGFGATSFSGGTRSVGSVGTAEISTDAYVRALQSEIRAIQAQTGAPFSVAEAEARGITQQVLSRLVVAASLEHEATEIGLSVGDAQVARDLSSIPAFQGPDGAFDRDAYAFALRNAGMTEAEFEADLRAESAATLLQAGMLSGITMPDAYTEVIVDYALETRDVTWARLTPGSLDTGISVPGYADLQSFYDENIARYTRPETRQITYAWLTPDMILDSVEIEEDALRAAYEDQAEMFNMPERRLVERLVYGDSASAEDAAERIATGDVSFEDLVAERGLDLADADMGDVTRDDLGAAAEAVFAARTGDIVVAPSPLGPALFRVNAVLEARQTSFEEAAPMLRDTLVQDRARRVIAGMAQSLDDELAAGATLEELARTTDLQLGQIAWTGEEADAIAGYEAFREAADTVTVEDFPQIADLGDGLFAIRLDAIEDPAPIPFDEVRDRVTRDWEDAARAEALVARAEALSARISAGESFEDVGLTPMAEAGLTRGARLAGLPAGVTRAGFALDAPGALQVLRDGTGAVIVRLDAITAADRDSDDARRLTAQLRDEAAAGVANDLFRALATDIQTRAGVELNEAALNAVHSTLQ
jgi:peptidyl-prolyl cis-trans isomerase D